MMHCLNNVFGHPCGYCMACRLNRQREKKVRLIHECENWKDKVFLTLTYDDEYIPAGCSLVKRDVQLFLKRLRKAIEPLRIKYFCCGEYGENTNRPHYHLIVYGLSVKHPVFKPLVQMKGAVDLGSVWDLGYVMAAPVTPNHCNYVAKYCLKKLGGAKAEEYYQGREPEFSLSSRGIGLEWAKKHHDRLVRDMCVKIGKSVSAIPRYYVDKVFDLVDKVKRQRYIKKFQNEALNREMIEMMEAGIDFGKRHAIEQYRIDKNDATKRMLGIQLQNSKGKTKNV